MNKLSKTLSLLNGKMNQCISTSVGLGICGKHNHKTAIAGLQHGHPGHCSAEVLELSAPAEICLGRLPLLVDAKLCP